MAAAFMCVSVSAAEKNNRIKPVIISPADNDKICAGDSLAVRYYAEEDSE